MDDHALAVDIGDLEVEQLCPAQSGCVQHHQHGAMHEVAGRLDEPRYVPLIENRRQSPLSLGKWNVVGKVRPTQRLDEQKAKCGGATLDGSGRQLALAKQISLVLADMVRAKRFRRTVEVPRKVFNRKDVRTYCALRVVATLEFIQHQLPKMAHGRPSNRVISLLV
jgi:hypothetical protein